MQKSGRHKNNKLAHWQQHYIDKKSSQKRERGPAVATEQWQQDTELWKKK